MVDPLITRWPVHSRAEIKAVGDILRSGLTNYWAGRENTAFETEWSQFVGLPHTLTVANGTVALEAAIKVLTPDLHEPERCCAEVIIPARTFMACASAAVHQGLVPVLADIDASSLCVTAQKLEAVRTENTVGVVLVHYAGLMIPGMNEIVRWAWENGIWLIEDCSHAHGAPVGRQSHIATWSMCYGKIMSSGGEGGMVSCLDDGIAARLRAYRDHGRYAMTGKVAHGGAVGTKYEYLCEDFGSNIRLTEAQAVIARYQLRELQTQLTRRREIAARYDEALGARALHTPEQRAIHSRYMYLARLANRDKVVEGLVERGIPARVGGTPSLAHEPAFTARGWVYPTPVADAVGAQIFSLPIYPSMYDEEVERVCVALREVIS